MPRTKKRETISREEFERYMQAAEERILRQVPSVKAEAKIVREFEMFRREMDPDASKTQDTVAGVWLMYLVETLALSSVITMGNHLFNHLNRSGLLGRTKFLTDTLKGLERDQAEEGALQRAKTCTAADAQKIMHITADGELAAQFWFMTNTGARVRDQNRVGLGQLTFSYDEDSGVIKAKFPTKTRKRVTDVRVVYLRAWMPPNNNVLIHLRKCLGLEKPPFTRSTAAFNNCLAAIHRDDQRIPKYTSYSFRRLFINRTIMMNRDDNLKIDWKAVLDAVGSQSEKILKSVYWDLDMEDADLTM